MEGKVTLSRKEITRVTVLNKVEKGEITGKQGTRYSHNKTSPGRLVYRQLKMISIFFLCVNRCGKDRMLQQME
jgi:hypothetical protein